MWTQKFGSVWPQAEVSWGNLKPDLLVCESHNQFQIIWLSAQARFGASMIKTIFNLLLIPLHREWKNIYTKALRKFFISFPPIVLNQHFVLLIFPSAPIFSSSKCVSVKSWKRVSFTIALVWSEDINEELTNGFDSCGEKQANEALIVHWCRTLFRSWLKFSAQMNRTEHYWTIAQ